MASNGLPHYTNSTAARKKYEPIYLNLFDVQLQPPAGAQADYPLIMENVRKVTGLDIDKVPAAVTQIYKGAPRSYAGALPDTLTVDINIEWEVNLDDANSMYVYTALQNWCKLTHDTQTGARAVKLQYAGGPLSVQVHNKAGEVFKSMVFYDIFPITNLPPLELDYSSGTNLYVVNLTFRSDWWEDTTL
jgi:hypothetical protein